MSEHEIQSTIETVVSIVTKPYQKTNNRYFIALMCVLLPTAVFVGIDLNEWHSFKITTVNELLEHDKSIRILQDEKNARELVKIQNIKIK